MDQSTSADQPGKRELVGPGRAVFLVWTGYNRRAESLAPKLDATVIYFPHLFRSNILRPLDYLVKVVRSIRILLASRPSVVFVQSPPPYTALAALLLRISYVVDVHHGVWQHFWGRLPLSDLILRKARALIVHYERIRDVAGDRLPPGSRTVVIYDAAEPIKWPVLRQPRQVLFICRFERGDPLDLIAEVIEAMPEYSFYITANVKKLSPTMRTRLGSLPNLTLTGFLPTEHYQRLLCSSAVVVDLDEAEYAQPTGACGTGSVEALASDTPLVISSSTLTKEKFGDWAWPVEHRTATIVAAIREAASQRLDLGLYRERWNLQVDASVEALRELLDAGTAIRKL